MLGLLGLLGILCAGAFADAVMVRAEPEGAEGNAAPEPEDEPIDPDVEGGNILDWVSSDVASASEEGSADPSVGADDIPDAPDAALTLTGTDGDDILAGAGGDDTVAGGAGNDLLGGGAGNDHIEGGSGRDGLNGGAGDDVLLGGADADVLDGNDGDDVLFGGEGDDRLAGHEGADSLNGDGGADTLIGGGGDDRLDGGAGDDWLDGGFGNDLLIGGAGQNTLDGGAGNDTLVGHGAEQPGGIDFLNAGRGDDMLVLGAGDIASGHEGADSFVVGSWINGVAARIDDFNAAEDDVLVVYDALAHPDPEVTIIPGPTEGSAMVMLDGMPLVEVLNGADLTVAMIRLTPEMPSYA